MLKPVNFVEMKTVQTPELIYWKNPSSENCPFPFANSPILDYNCIQRSET